MEEKKNVIELISTGSLIALGFGICIVLTVMYLVFKPKKKK